MQHCVKIYLHIHFDKWWCCYFMIKQSEGVQQEVVVVVIHSNLDEQKLLNSRDQEWTLLLLCDWKQLVTSQNGRPGGKVLPVCNAVPSRHWRMRLAQHFQCRQWGSRAWAEKLPAHHLITMHKYFIFYLEYQCRNNLFQRRVSDAQLRCYSVHLNVRHWTPSSVWIKSSYLNV